MNIDQILTMLAVLEREAPTIGIRRSAKSLFVQLTRWRYQGEGTINLDV